MPATKKVHVKTFGCQMNVYDSERMTEALLPLGYSETSKLDDADVVILNTCHIREKAVEKVYADLGRIRDMKESRRKDGKETIITVAGCVAQAEGAEIARRMPSVDLVVGPQSYHRLPELLFRTKSESRRIVETQFPEEDKFSGLPERDITSAAAKNSKVVSAFLTVQEGCDKFCTFCVVPYTRGMEYSRPVSALEAEARRLVARGVAEITLLGQNVNGYHGEGPDGQSSTLAKLIRHLSGIEGLQRIRYTTSHPNDMSEDLIAAHREEAKLMPFLHLAVQSGSDRILAAMNRKHTAKEYLNLIDRVRGARPDMAISTDIIVGFPGETDRDFEATLDVVRQAGCAHAYSFKYSPRPGTPAAKMDGQIPEKVKAERLTRLQAQLEGQMAAFNAGSVGLTLPVLFERTGKSAGQFVGRSPYLQNVQIAGAAASAIGQILPVEITAAGPRSLSGVVAAR